MASNSNYFWHTTYSGNNPIQRQDLEEYDSLEDALFSAINYDGWGPGVRKIIIYFP